MIDLEQYTNNCEERSYGDPHLDANEIDALAAEARLLQAELELRKHARKCHACFLPVIDSEGNPGLIGEACTHGAELIRAYLQAEACVLQNLEGGK